MKSQIKNTKAYNMKTILRFSTVLLFLLPVCLFATDYKKEYSKSYEVSSNATLELDCSFASIEVKTVPGNKIDIHVEVNVDASSEEKAEKTFDRISVQLIGNSKKVTVKTELGKQNTKNESFDMTITISAPADIELVANTSFGTLELGKINGRSTVNHQYGEFNFSDAQSSDNDIKVSFGSAWIGNFGGGSLTTEFGEMNIDKISGDAVLKNSYGDLEIDQVSSTCKKLDVDTSFADTEINLDSSSSFSVNASSSFGDISLPKSIQVNREKKDWNSSSYEGVIGSGTGQLKVNCSFGDIKIRTH